MAFRGELLLIFPIAVLIAFICLNASGGPSLSAKPTPTSFCKVDQNCAFNQSANIVYYNCDYSNWTWCTVLPNCVLPTPPPFWCFPYPVNQIPGFTGTKLNPGFFGEINATAASQAAGGMAIFGFNSNGGLAFIGFITVIIGVATLAGFNIFGSGLENESIQILAQGALLMGLWAILSGLEGVGASSPDMFAQLDAVFGLGTVLYAVLTIMVLLGFAGTISRSGI